MQFGGAAVEIETVARFSGRRSFPDLDIALSDHLNTLLGDILNGHQARPRNVVGPVTRTREGQKHGAGDIPRMDEVDPRKSLLACKKTDFRNIDIFELKHLDNRRSSIFEEWKSIHTIRFESFDLTKAKLNFSDELDKVIFCNLTSNIVLNLP